MKFKLSEDMTIKELETLVFQVNQFCSNKVEIARNFDGWWSVMFERGDEHDYQDMSFTEAVAHLQSIISPPETVTIQIPFRAAKAAASDGNRNVPSIAKACREAIAKYT